MSLINKYEPDKLEKIIGNDKIKTILSGFLKQNKKPQVYMFSGPFGCGKSLIAKIYSNLLDCNVVELNASNDRGINSIRQLLQDCSFISLDKKPKAFIIEECHQLPTLSQEALLTTLQNPPKDVYFFFCTTEKQKMLKTIISRCKVFDVELLGTRQIYPYLIKIAEQENKKISKTVSRRIADTSQGHMRDAIQILESVLQFSDEIQQLEVASEIKEQSDNIKELCQLLLRYRPWQEVRSCLSQMKKENIIGIRAGIINYMSTVLLNNNSPDLNAARTIEALQNPIYDFPVLVMQLFSLCYQDD